MELPSKITFFFRLLNENVKNMKNQNRIRRGKNLPNLVGSEISHSCILSCKGKPTPLPYTTLLPYNKITRPTLNFSIWQLDYFGEELLGYSILFLVVENFSYSNLTILSPISTSQYSTTYPLR